MPDPRNVLELIQLVAAMIVTNVAHDSGDACKCELLCLQRVVELPLLRKASECIPRHNAYSTAAREICFVRTVEFSHVTANARGNRREPAQRVSVRLTKMLGHYTR